MTRARVASLFWLATTAILLVVSWALTLYVGYVSIYDSVGNGYSVGFYSKPDPTLREPDANQDNVWLILLERNGRVTLNFRGHWRGGDSQRVVFQQSEPPECDWVNGEGTRRLTPTRVGASGWWAVTIPDAVSSRVLECLVTNEIRRRSFSSRGVYFSNEKDVGRPEGFVARPMLLDMAKWGVMADSHFFMMEPDVDGVRQIDEREYRFAPDASGRFEWTSAREEGREIYILVIIGALVAVAAATFIEGLRPWLDTMFDRLATK